MAVGLRKIAEHATGPGIEFFREQAHVVAAREQTGEKLARFAIAIMSSGEGKHSTKRPAGLVWKG